jgi:hypothetical protein
MDKAQKPNDLEGIAGSAPVQRVYGVVKWSLYSTRSHFFELVARGSVAG